jgi:hypothetical protein
MGEPVKKPSVSLEAHPEHFEFVKRWVTEVEALLEQKQILVHQIRVGKGLENVFEGLDLMRNSKVSGQKLVYVL